MKNIMLFVLGSILSAPSAFAFEDGQKVKVSSSIVADWTGVKKHAGAFAIDNKTISKRFSTGIPGDSILEKCNLTIRGYGNHLMKDRELIVKKGKDGITFLLDSRSHIVVASVRCNRTHYHDMGLPETKLEDSLEKIAETLGLKQLNGHIKDVKPVDTPADAGSAG